MGHAAGGLDGRCFDGARGAGLALIDIDFRRFSPGLRDCADGVYSGDRPR